jgi:Transcription factor S-II (TFIIS)
MAPVEVTRAKVQSRMLAIVGDELLAKRLEVMTWNSMIAHCKAQRIPVFWQNPRVPWWYTHKALSVEHNIKTNPLVLERLKAGTLGVRDFFAMKPWEIRPDLWEAAFDEAAKKELRRSEYHPDPETTPDGAFQCGKCGSKKTTYYEMQTRSADEPMTLFIQCVMCRARWKK